MNVKEMNEALNIIGMLEMRWSVEGSSSVTILGRFKGIEGVDSSVENIKKVVQKEYEKLIKNTEEKLKAMGVDYVKQEEE